MKYTKFAVIGAGVLGLIAFFMPLIHVKSGGFEGKASAFDVIKGLSAAEDAAHEGQRVAAGLGEADAADLAGGLKEGANTAKWIMYIPFVPCAFFVLFGALGLLRRYGRLLGVGTLIFGLIGLGIWALLRAAAKETGVEDSLGSGVTMLMVSYVLATLGGLVALIKPEPKKAAAPAAPAPVMPPQG
ncbi:MAG: hypothetical protein HY905_25550 [Deltaproteobacteria bacterium]|nr:hypothetical protein [Deltaproteobacteria bacterium]